MGSNGETLPASMLFACEMNTVRSAMAEAIMKQLYGQSVLVDSVGVHKGKPDPFAIAVMKEIGIDLSRHRPKTFAELDAGSFDLVVSLSPVAHHRAIDLTLTQSIETEYWPCFDVTAAAGNREQILDAYRQVRDHLVMRIKQRFSAADAIEV